MSVQVAPPLVVMSRNPPPAPTAMRFRSKGLTPRLYGLERNVRDPSPGKPGEIGGWPGCVLAAPMSCHDSPPLAVRQTRVFEKWKKTRPLESSAAGAGMIAVKNGNPKSASPPVAAVVL